MVRNGPDVNRLMQALASNRFATAEWTVLSLSFADTHLRTIEVRTVVSFIVLLDLDSFDMHRYSRIISSIAEAVKHNPEPGTHALLET